MGTQICKKIPSSFFYKGIMLTYHSAARAFFNINVIPCIVVLLLSEHILLCFEILWITLRERHKREREMHISVAQVYIRFCLGPIA